MQPFNFDHNVLNDDTRSKTGKTLGDELRKMLAGFPKPSKAPKVESDWPAVDISTTGK